MCSNIGRLCNETENATVLLPERLLSLWSAALLLKLLLERFLRDLREIAEAVCASDESWEIRHEIRGTHKKRMLRTRPKPATARYTLQYIFSIAEDQVLYQHAPLNSVQ